MQQSIRVLDLLTEDEKLKYEALQDRLLTSNNHISAWIYKKKLDEVVKRAKSRYLHSIREVF
ncbi:hypothetical protein ACQKFO_21635 [Rossellomorea sp. NPDC071047]|jgi:hypothetical protein|uniref:hypothetical protein n=1 Tax=Rossellomorea sp. NPDC071047 TaxID=3390675 RepID=UPI003CFC5678